MSIGSFPSENSIAIVSLFFRMDGMALPCRWLRFFVGKGIVPVVGILLLQVNAIANSGLTAGFQIVFMM